jgi:hypothetical protein
MTTFFSFIFFHSDINYYCLVRPRIYNNTIEYQITVTYVNYGLSLQEEYTILEENGKITEEESFDLESTIKKYTVHALEEHLNKRRLVSSAVH